MELSPKRQPSPPFLKGGRKGLDAGALARRRSFGEGSCMTLSATAAEIASDARASEEAKLWREQLLASQQAPAAGATSALGVPLAYAADKLVKAGMTSGLEGWLSSSRPLRRRGQGIATTQSLAKDLFANTV